MNFVTFITKKELIKIFRIKYTYPAAEGERKMAKEDVILRNKDGHR